MLAWHNTKYMFWSEMNIATSSYSWWDHTWIFFLQGFCRYDFLYINTILNIYVCPLCLIIPLLKYYFVGTLRQAEPQTMGSDLTVHSLDKWSLIVYPVQQRNGLRFRRPRIRCPICSIHFGSDFLEVWPSHNSIWNKILILHSIGTHSKAQHRLPCTILIVRDLLALIEPSSTASTVV